MIARARESVAAFVNARGADEIAFGLNATSFIRSISLAIGQTLGSTRARDHRQRSRSRVEHRDLARARARRRPHRLVARAGGGGRRAAAPGGSRAAADRAHAARRLHHGLERHRQPRRRRRRGAARARGRRRGLSRRGALRAARARSTCRRSTATTSSARATRSSRRTWGSPGAGARRSIACRRFARTSSPTSRPDKLEAGTYVYENVAGMEAAVAYLEQLGGRMPATRTATETIRAAMTRDRRVRAHVVGRAPGRGRDAFPA